jgi:hypothetical protein
LAASESLGFAPYAQQGGYIVKKFYIYVDTLYKITLEASPKLKNQKKQSLNLFGKCNF